MSMQDTLLFKIWWIIFCLWAILAPVVLVVQIFVLPEVMLFDKWFYTSIAIVAPSVPFIMWFLCKEIVETFRSMRRQDDG